MKKGSSGFLSRLDDATTTIRAERKDITPVKGPLRLTSKGDDGTSPFIDGPIRMERLPTPGLDLDAYDDTADKKDYGFKEKESHQNKGSDGERDDKGGSKDEHGNTYEHEEEEEDLVSLCSEYIFDLFDANMMEDYHTVANFELRALDAFLDPHCTEISFEQHNLHKEFLELFEKLIEKFLLENNASKDVFYKQVQSYIHRPTKTERDEAKKVSADQVVDVIFCYTDLQMWCNAMRERSALRAKYASQGGNRPKPKTQLQEMSSLETVAIKKSPSTSHRFDI
jgi:hypothetical protein